MEGNADFVFFSKWLHEAHSWSRLSALLSTAASVREIRRTNTNCCCVSAVIKLQPRGSHSLVAGCEYIQTVFLLIGADVECFPCNKSSCIFLRAELHPPPPAPPPTLSSSLPPSPSHSCRVSNPHPLCPLLSDLKGRKTYKVGLTSDQITNRK